MRERVFPRQLVAVIAAAVLVSGGAAACGKSGSGGSSTGAAPAGPGSGAASGSVTYEATSSVSGVKAHISYLKKVPPQGSTPNVVTGDEYVGVLTVDLPWKAEVTLDGGAGSAYLAVTYDPSAIKFDADNPSPPAALSASFTCSISAGGKQVEHQESKAATFCAGPDIKKKVPNVGH